MYDQILSIRLQIIDSYKIAEDFYHHNLNNGSPDVFSSFCNKQLLSVSPILILGTTLKLITWYYKALLNLTGSTLRRLEKPAQGDVPKITAVNFTDLNQALINFMLAEKKI